MRRGKLCILTPVLVIISCGNGQCDTTQDVNANAEKNGGYNYKRPPAFGRLSDRMD